MIALTLKDGFDGTMEVSVQPSLNDDSKNCVVIEIQSESNEKDELWDVFYYIENREQLNALISKLISAKKHLPD